jgi:uncharacterized protein with HEPN domain/predicted nucleotidyltransferase
MNAQDAISILRQHENALRARGVAHAAVFGSVARGSNRPDSDLDILVEFEEGSEGTIYEYVRFKEFVAGLFQGPVDVIDRAALKPHQRLLQLVTRYMLSEKDTAALHHIDLAEHFAQGRTFQNLRDDLMPLYAVTRCLEIISEASRRLSEEMKARHPEMPWREMAAAGNFYRHNYEDVLPRRVWKTLREDLPLLRAVIERELDDAG